MKFLIYGAGVIGSIFAAKLSLSGQDVTVLARGKRLDEFRSKGVVLNNPKTGKKETANVKTIDKLLPDDKYDYIIVAMQRTQVGSILESFAGNYTENTVFAVNTTSGYDEWKNVIGAERLQIDFPSAGGELSDGIVSCFLGKGMMRSFQTTTFGEAAGKRDRESVRYHQSIQPRRHPLGLVPGYGCLAENPFCHGDEHC